MIRSSFNDDWQVRPKVNPFAELSGAVTPFQPVTLPHDAMLALGRGRSAAEGAPAGLRPTGPGTSRLLATAPGCDPAETALTVE